MNATAIISEIVYEEVVDKLKVLFNRVSGLAGRRVIDLELNKKRDPAMTERINNALRYMLQNELLLRDYEDSEPKFWLASRDVPLDKDDKPVLLRRGTTVKRNFNLMPKKQTSVAQIEKPPVVDVPSEPLAKTSPKGPISLDNQLLAFVTDTYAKTQAPVDIATILAHFSADHSIRILKMRLSYQLKVNRRLQCWLDEDSHPEYFAPMDLDSRDAFLNTQSYGEPAVFEKKPRKPRKSKTLVYEQPIIGVSAVDTSEELEEPIVEEQEQEQESYDDREEHEQEQEEASENEEHPTPMVYLDEDEAEPVWSMESTGTLSCLLNNSCCLFVSRANVASLYKFLKNTEAIHSGE